MPRKYTKAKAESNRRYDEKTYKRYILTLRMVEDADIIESIERSKEHGESSREWIRMVFDRCTHVAPDDDNR